MKIKNLQMKKALRTVLFVLLLCAAGMTKAQNENITFADVIVKAYCVANWDTDGDGELNLAEAAAVTSLDGVFMFDGDITSFNELQFFTGLTSFGEDEFNSCTSLAAISIPSAVNSIGNYAFSDCSSLTSMTSYACTPPTLGNEVFYNVPSVLVLNVPCHTAALYQAADGWSDFANYEEFEYGLCPIIFADDNVKAICVAHWDTNEDGELSYAEAAAVTNLGTYFKSTSITSFDELEYFTSLTSLPNTAFYGCTSLASIALPASVSALGNGSFYNCSNLFTMTIFAETPPTVGTNAFKNVPIEMVVYVPCGTYAAYHTASGWSEFTIVQQSGSCPIIFADANVKALCVANWDTDGDGELSYDEAAAVTDLGQVFKNNSSILSFDELQYFIGLTTIGYQTFYFCTGLTSIRIPNSVTSIGSYAFDGCSDLTMLEIPNSVTSIGYWAFSSCGGLISIEIPNSVTSMVGNPFESCIGLEQIIVDSGNTVYDSRENCNAIINTSTNELVVGCKHTIIPNSVISIGSEAFRGCRGLISIAISNSVTSIGSWAFSYCNRLVSIEIPNSVISIGSNTFYSCSDLISITLPNSVTSIGGSAFSGCIGMTSLIVFANNPPAFGNNTFGNIEVPVYVPCGSVELYTAANWGGFNNFIGFCAGEIITTANPTEGGTVTGGGYYEDGATFTLTATANTGYSFINWTKDNVGVSNSETYSFYVTGNASYVANFVQGNIIIFADPNVKTLCVANWDTNGDGELSFAEASAVTNLGTVFKNKRNLTTFDELQYFTGLTSIGSEAFYYCSNLTSIKIPNSVTSIKYSAFYHCSSLTSIEIPNSVTLISDFAFYYCSSLTSIEIPSSVNLISGAFSYCSGIEQIIVDSGNAVYDSRENCNAIIKTSTNTLIMGCKNTIIPNSVTSIGSSAFSGCTGLTFIEIPNSVTSIGGLAFGDCTGLISITIPNSVSYLGSAQPFDGCSCLEQIIVESSNSVYDSRENCNAIIKTSTNELVAGCKNTVIPNSVTTIGDYAFSFCQGYTGVLTIPNSVISIGLSAFRDCTGLTSIEIPNSVTNIRPDAFANCSYLTSIVSFAETPPLLGNRAFYNVNKSIPVYVPTGTVSAYQSASGWSEFTNYIDYGSPIIFADANVKALCVANWDTNGDDELSYSEAAAVTDLGQVFKNNNTITSFNELQYFTGLTFIGIDAFYNCRGLTVIEIPSSVTSIGSNAFVNCLNLTSIEIPNLVTSIGANAFGGCRGLTSIEIPNSVTSIGNGAFFICSGLTSIEIPNSVTSIDRNPFAGCSSLEQIVVNSGNAVYDSRSNCNAIVNSSTNELVTGCKNTVIPNSVISIGEHAFRYCTSMTTIQIPNSVTSIGYEAFGYCSALTSIEIPNSVITLGNYAFNQCSGLTSIEISNSVTTIGDLAFQGCTALTSIEIPCSVISIGDMAFNGCNGLTSIEIPNSVISIGLNPFRYCNGLEQITVASDNSYYDSRENCNAIIRTSNNELVTGCKNTIILNTVTRIGWGAFEGCSGLIGNLIVPNSVTYINLYAFENCSGLTSIVSFAETPPVLDMSAFYGVNKTIPLYVPCGASDAYQSTNGWNEFTNIIGMCPGTITVAALPMEGGSVTGGGSYEGGGATCTLTATANHDYCFLNWTENGEVVSSDAEYTFLVTGDRILVANFSFIPPAPVVAEYHPDPNEPNGPYVKVHWAASSFEAQIGEGTSTFGYFPFYTLYNYSISENLFLASELEEAGVNTAPMTSLSWYATNAPGYEQQGISIWMANVSDTELTTTSHTVNDMTLVYTGTITPEIGWNEFVFNEGTFVWDGVSNVLILCQRNNGVWNSTVYWQSQNVGFNASSYRYQDSGPYNVNIANTMYNSNQRPNIIMKSEGAMTYNLYRANCDGTGAQLIAENLNDTQYIDETWWQLENDSYKYGVSIADSTNTDIFWSNCIEKQGDVVVQTVALSEGWNWFSTYLDITLDDLKAALVSTLPGTTSIKITSQSNGSTTYNGMMWRGALNVMDMAQMYMIEVTADCEITLMGNPINPAEHPVTIHNGINWMAFPLSESMTLSNAFAGFALNGDMVSSQSNGSATYTSQWRGQLSILEPGKGYMYKSNVQGDRIFIFPISTK